MKTGVIGCGTVGGALVRWLREKGHAVAALDPDKQMIDPNVRTADVVFVCVPTPFVQGKGFDDEPLRTALAVLDGLMHKVVVIKSTVPPGTTDRMALEFPLLRLLFSPEFLSEDTADLDMYTPERQIVGYTEGNEILAVEILGLLAHAPYSVTMPARAAEIVKYVSNAFYALKVAYANQMADLCANLGVSWSDVRQAAASDPMVGPGHLDIFHKGYRGYGGKCLPKDVKTLLALAGEVGVDLSLLRAAEEYNASLKGT